MNSPAVLPPGGGQIGFREPRSPHRPIERVRHLVSLEHLSGVSTTIRRMAPAGSREFLFTSESVTEGHPDKIADQISDGVLDEVLRRDPRGRVACEVLVTTGLVVVAGEITTDAYVDIPRVVRDTVRDIGYTDAAFGFDFLTCGVVVAIDEQSPDIRQGRSTPRTRSSATGPRPTSTRRARATRG